MGAISQRELRNDSGGVLRRVASGEIITVTRRGVPIADLIPHQDQTRQPMRFVPADRINSAMAGLPGWDVDRFDREQSNLDENLDDEWRDPWRE